MVETAKRLQPTFPTLRDLFVHSGNECAFPGCERRLVNPKGQWVGEVCHICAALPGGERFDEDMTNEARRDRANLLLLCHDHHVETNDVDEFPVDALRGMKAAHEALFAGQPPIPDDVLEHAVRDIVAASIEDQTDRVVLRLPQTLLSFSTHQGHELGEEERRGTIELLQPTLEALRRIPVDPRAVFAILVDRTPPGNSVCLPIHEIEMATGTGAGGLADSIDVLERYRLAGAQETWAEDRPTFWELDASEVGGWDFWTEFRVYCQERGLRPKDVINDLRFDLLD